MSETLFKARTEIPLKYTWDLSSLYPSWEAWDSALERVYESECAPHWPSLALFRDRLEESPEVVAQVLSLYLAIEREAHKLYTYAHLRHDEQTTDTKGKEALSLAMALLQTLEQEASWITPELLSLKENTFQSLLTAPSTAGYRTHLERIGERRPHTLSKNEERLLALAGQALSLPSRAFSALSDSDFSFGTVENSEGVALPLTHGSYQLFLRDRNRNVRKTAFEQYYKQYSSFENTLCELINGQIQKNRFLAKSRNYQSSLHAALHANQIDTQVYDILIATVEKFLPLHHRYLRLRKELLGLEELHFYDLGVPLTPNFDLSVPYSQAEEWVIESVFPLGEEYQAILKEGLCNRRWVDCFESPNKRSGGYSSGCYDSAPYILLNHKGTARDLFTLAHEAGHSMHSYLSRREQPYHYAEYSIFLAEIASTFNEELLMQWMLPRVQSAEEKFFLIHQQIDGIRATLLRQTMFATFEREIHAIAEGDQPITPTKLKELYLQLIARYFGSEVVIDDLIAIEWARIPHFYYNFYVFQYATGISAALAFTEQFKEEPLHAQKRYLSLLAAGSSRPPLELLTAAGVNLLTPKPIEAALHHFEKLLNQLEELAPASRK